MAAILTRVLIALAVIFYGPDRGCPSSSQATITVTTPAPLDNMCPVLLPIQLSYFTPLSFVPPPAINTPTRTNLKALPLNVCANLLPIERSVPSLAVTTINDLAAAIGHAGPGAWSGRGNADAAYGEEHSQVYGNSQRPQTTTRRILALWTNTLTISILTIALHLVIVNRQSRRLQHADGLVLEKQRRVSSLLDDVLECTKKLSGLDELVADLRDTIARQGELHAKTMKANCKRLRAFVTCSQLLYNWKIKSRDAIIKRLEAQLTQASRDMQDMTEAKDAQFKAAETDSDLQVQQLRSTIVNRDLQIDDLTAQLAQSADELAETVQAKDNEISAAQKELRNKNGYIQRTTDNMKHIILQKEDDIETLTVTIQRLEEESASQVEIGCLLQDDRQTAIDGWESARQDNAQLRKERQNLREHLRQRSLDVKELEELRESNVELMDLVDRLEEEVAQEVASVPLTPATTIDDALSTLSSPSEIATRALDRDLPIVRPASSKRKLAAEFDWLRSLKTALRRSKKAKTSP